MMKRLLIVAVAALALGCAVNKSHAQALTKICFPAETGTGKAPSCRDVTLTNPLPTTATLSAAGGINVTVTNTTGTPVIVSNPNGFGGNITGTLTVQNLAAGSSLNVLDTNSAALLAAAQAGTGTTGSAVPGSANYPGLNIAGTLRGQTGVNPSGSIFAAQVAPVLQTTGGWTTALLNALSTTVITVKNGTGQLSRIYCFNPNASVAYIQVFNATPGNVTLGTTVPQNSYAIASSAIGGFSTSVVGDQFATAISVAATTTVKGLTAPNTALDCNASFN